jgi:hypothetical protein
MFPGRFSQFIVLAPIFLLDIVYPLVNFQPPDTRALELLLSLFIIHLKILDMFHKP